MSRLSAQASLGAMFCLGVACADLPDLKFNQCGNGVLEPAAGEICDSRVDPDLGVNLVCGPPDTVGACQYLCRDAMQCPLGWRCGEDSVCRQPSANFRLGSAGLIDLASSRLELADLDGDRTLDVVVAGTESVSVLFSDGRGGLESTEVVTTRVAGRIAFSDVDGDGVQDLGVPTGAGLQVFSGNPSRRLLPLPGGPVPALPANNLLAYGRGPTASSGFVAIEASADSWLIEAEQGELTLPISGEARVFVRRLSGMVDSLLVTDSRGLVIVDLSGDRPSLQQELPVSSAVRNIEAVDLDADGDQDLWIEGARTLIALRQAGGFSDPVVDQRFAEGELLAAGDLNADGIADAVRSDGLWLSRTATAATPATYTRVLEPSANAWTQATVGNFDEDSRTDIAVIAGEEARIEYRLQQTAGVFSAFGVQTPGRPGTLVSGDFDGDGVDDLAFVSSRISSTTLNVLFGDDFDLVALHTEAGDFEIQALTAPVAASHFDSWRDLLVSGGDGVFVFLGSPSRALQAPFIFGRPEGANVINATGRGEQLVVQTGAPSLWTLSSGEAEASEWPPCLSGLGPECVLSASDGTTTVYVGPANGCPGASMIAVALAASCEASTLSADTHFSDLNYDSERKQFLAGASRQGAGAVYVHRVGQPLDSLVEIEFAAPVLSAAAADLDSDGASEVLALTTAGVEPRFGAQLNQSTDPLMLPGLQVGDTGRLRIFDSDGDRLDDLVVGSESRLILFRGEAQPPMEAAE